MRQIFKNEDENLNWGQQYYPKNTHASDKIELNLYLNIDMFIVILLLNEDFFRT